ncbi:MAG: peptidyl-prolyl cis-trans isomerase [Lachnospiraceae bacterium]|nr:peptidyl-prolyl cis-trans isomerase [Lachnospiraceae bacterium]
MKFWKKSLLLILTLVVSITCFSGCTIGNREVYFASKSGWHTVFKIGDMSCHRDEFRMYLANYKNIYGNVYGTDLWNGDYDTDTMETSVKNAAIEHLSKVYALNLYAKDNDIVLTEPELEKVNDAALEYYDSLSRAERKYTGASKKEVIEMYERYALACKVYQKLMAQVDVTVSEDEARVMHAFILFTTDKDKAKNIQTNIDNGATFERLATTYNELDTTRITFGRGIYDKEIEDVVFRLDDGEVSDMITTDDGYYFFQCINKYDEEMSETNKASIVKERREMAINNVVSELDKKYYADLNKKLIDKISMPTDENIKTNSFFKVLDSHIKFD